MTFTDSLTIFLVLYEPHLLFACLIIAFIISALMEIQHPRRIQKKEGLRHRFPVNGALFAIEVVNVNWVASFTAVGLRWFSDGREFGLIPYLDVGFWFSVVLALFVFELVSYFIHRILHAFPILWRIHAVHHCDSEVDFTTTFRNHPLELLVTVPITVPIVVVLGFPAAAVVLYQFFRTAILVFAHSNIRLPEHVDRPLRLFLTTPDYHRVHHSSNRFYTDSNFSPVLPLYDYAFGTAKRIESDQLGSMHVGLEYLDSHDKTRLINLLLLPFCWKKLIGEETSDASSAPIEIGDRP